MGNPIDQKSINEALKPVTSQIAKRAFTGSARIFSDYTSIIAPLLVGACLIIGLLVVTKLAEANSLPEYFKIGALFIFGMAGTAAVQASMNARNE